jgi:hypothetical protein
MVAAEPVATKIAKVLATTDIVTADMSTADITEVSAASGTATTTTTIIELRQAETAPIESRMSTPQQLQSQLFSLPVFQQVF